MKKSDIKVLLVEDDLVSGRALSELIRRAGFQCHWAKTPPEAINVFKLQGFHLAIIDCVLPQMNGVDLIKRLQLTQSANIPVVLISGIFKDPKFAKSAREKPGVVGFFTKPIESEDLLQLLEQQFAEMIEPQSDPHEMAFAKEKLSSAEIMGLLSKTNTMHGYQLPQVLALLLHSDLSGSLNLIERKGEISSVSFSSGRVTYVNKRHSRSIFGALLIESGFASEEDVQAGLQMNSNKPIGERLVENGVLSPHMIDVVRTEQMRIRISELIQDTMYDINFLPETISPAAVELALSDLPSLLKDWCWSKIDEDWLKTFFRPLMAFGMQFRHAEDIVKTIQSIQLDMGEISIEQLMASGVSLRENLERHPDQETTILRFLYFLVVQKRILFRQIAAASPTDYKEDLKRLERLYSEIKDKGPFEALGLTKEARGREITKSYLDMAKALHPDKWGPQAPHEVRDLSQKIFTIISTSYEQIKDETRRVSYLKTLEIGHATDALRTENDLNQAEFLLTRGKIKEATEILLRIPKHKIHESQIRLLLLWAKARKNTSGEPSNRLAEEIRKELNYVPPEDRHSATYFFVRGLMYKAAQNYEKALANFQRSSMMDVEFEEARKEARSVEAKLSERAGNTLIGTVVTKFFGKKNAS
jgi:CheY-like chemotaxis protein/curved DNA-binding protein CbpA